MTKPLTPPLISKYYIIFKNRPSFIASFPYQILSVADKIIIWVGMHVKEVILSVSFHVYFTDANEILLLSIFKNYTEEKIRFCVRHFNKIITV